MKKFLLPALLFFLLMLLFAGCGSAAAKKEPAGSGGVRVTVQDELGTPVEGVRVEACDDKLCVTAVTDADGTAHFPNAGVAAIVHILRVPEGFLPAEGDFQADETGNLSVVLRRSAADPGVTK